MDLNIKDFDLLPVSSVKTLVSTVEEELYDITVDGNHTFYTRQ